MHSAQVRDEILRLTSLGVNDCEVSRRTGIARATVRDIRRRAAGEMPGAKLDVTTCPRCWRAARAIRFESGDYAELLGLYLGDGHIVEMARTHKLRIFLDSKYPEIVRDTAELMRRSFPANSVGLQYAHEGRMSVVSVYSEHLPCLFPQHGPGLKHKRLIALEPWQQEFVDQHPWRVLKGLIRSDGCSFVNRTGRYEYLSYHFSNKSDGVCGIFIDACRRAGIDYRCNFNPRRELWEVRINRRPSVALLLAHVGVKK